MQVKKAIDLVKIDESGIYKYIQIKVIDLKS